jgi:two-component system, OmpR family, sensor histidine kinase KdpD
MSSSTPTNFGTVEGSPPPSRGKLKLFLGYAAGVGKTYRMLEEAQHLQREGRNIVVGYFEPHDRKDTIAKTLGLEMIPTSCITYRGVALKEMDTSAILARHPATCVVDELAHTNVPGSERAKRWEDVQVLLDAGIHVLTNMNIQHLESLNDHIFRITGVRVRETVPDWFVKSADEVVMVDATTGALLNRMRRGDIYAPEKAQRAMDNFFKESTLAALRELALRQTAHELEIRQTIDEPKGQDRRSPIATRRESGIRDRILVYVTADPTTAMLIRRTRRMADYLDADCFAVAVTRAGQASASVELQNHLNFARNLHIDTRVLEGVDSAETLLEFAQRNQITQIVIGRPRSRSWSRFLGRDPILRLVQEARNLRVIVVADRRAQQQPSQL